MIQQQIFALQDKPYGEFQSRLLPTIAKERIIGVRIPVMRKLAKQLTKEEPEAVQAFLEELQKGCKRGKSTGTDPCRALRRYQPLAGWR